MLMNAKEAREETKKIQEERKRILEENELKEKLYRAKEEEFNRTKGVEVLLEKFNEILNEKIKNGANDCWLSSKSRITMEIASEHLKENGYFVSNIREIFHPAYTGCVDDGFVYAEDSYHTYDISVSW